MRLLFLHHRYHHLPLELVQRMIIMKVMPQIIDLGVKGPLKQHSVGEGNEKLSPPMSEILS